jgi:hypothetical protein
MFKRIRYAAAVLRSRPAPDSPEWMTSEVERHKREGDSFGEETCPQNEVNPAVVVLEFVVSLELSALVLLPLAHALFKSVNGKESGLVGVGLSVVFFYTVDRLVEHFSVHGKLRRLNPYFGKRLRRTMQILKG